MGQGLAIDTSDMDLCIVGLECNGDKDLERSYLKTLAEALFKLLPISIISKKMEILDTEFPLIKIEFLIEDIETLYRHPHSEVKYINVDITIDANKNHYGVKV